MNIERIYTRHVVSTPASSLLVEAAAMMRKHHVGTLVVLADGPEHDAIGIVTDRDMVLQAMAEGLSPREVTVGEVMTPVVATVPEGASVHEALERMRARGVRRLLVTKPGGAIAGIISMDDIIDGLAADLQSLAGLPKSEVRREIEQYDGDAKETAAY